MTEKIQRPKLYKSKIEESQNCESLDEQFKKAEQLMVEINKRLDKIENENKRNS